MLENLTDEANAKLYLTRFSTVSSYIWLKFSSHRALHQRNQSHTAKSPINFSNSAGQEINKQSREHLQQPKLVTDSMDIPSWNYIGACRLHIHKLFLKPRNLFLKIVRQLSYPIKGKQLLSLHLIVFYLYYVT